MKKLVESVPNISEGRDKDVIEEIVNEFKKFKNIKILEVSSDESHNRTVVTIVGNVDDVVETANHFRCVDLIIDKAKAMLTENFIKEAILKHKDKYD